MVGAVGVRAIFQHLFRLSAASLRSFVAAGFPLLSGSLSAVELLLAFAHIFSLIPFFISHQFTPGTHKQNPPA